MGHDHRIISIRHNGRDVRRHVERWFQLGDVRWQFWALRITAGGAGATSNAEVAAAFRAAGPKSASDVSRPFKGDAARPPAITLRAACLPICNEVEVVSLMLVPASPPLLLLHQDRKTKRPAGRPRPGATKLPRTNVFLTPLKIEPIQDVPAAARDCLPFQQRRSLSSTTSAPGRAGARLALRAPEEPAGRKEAATARPAYPVSYRKGAENSPASQAILPATRPRLPRPSRQTRQAMCRASIRPPALARRPPLRRKVRERTHKVARKSKTISPMRQASAICKPRPLTSILIMARNTSGGGIGSDGVITSNDFSLPAPPSWTGDWTWVTALIMNMFVL